MDKRKVLGLYKLLLRESQKFPAYNFRNYALRKVRDSFKEHKKLTDKSEIIKKIEEATNNLETIKRQVVIGKMYSTDQLVIEKIASRS